MKAEGGREVHLLRPQDSLPRPDLEADQSAMKLMGYQTSHKEI